MARYLAVDKNGSEWIFNCKPIRGKTSNTWLPQVFFRCEDIPKGSIAKLIGKELTWDDEPYLFE